MDKGRIPAFLAAVLLFACAEAYARQKPQQDQGLSADTASVPSEEKRTSDQVYLRRHYGPVLSLAQVPDSSSFFSSGNDGFLSLHFENGSGESWQISNIPIRAIAVHPDGNRVAVYESDGFSIHRVSVWDWKLKTRIFAKRFRDSVISLSWSAKGSYLIIGNTSIEGITVLDSAKGNQESLFGAAPGIVSLGITGASETSIITFGPSGVIRYTDTSSGKERASYQGEQDLTAPVLLANNMRIAGYRDGAIYELDATSGKSLAVYPAEKPIMATKGSDAAPVWIEQGLNSEWMIRSGNDASMPFALKDNGFVTAALSLDGKIIAGTSDGMLYSIKTPILTGERVSPSLLYKDTMRVIDDIASDGSRLFFLSSGSVYESEGNGERVSLLFAGVKGNRMAIVDSQFAFWADDKGGELALTTFDGTAWKNLYKARDGIHSLSVLGTMISFVEGTSMIRVIDTAAPSAQFSYAGAGFQDAVLISTDKLVVSKSATSRSPNPLLFISTATGETVSLPFQGDLCYGLRLVEAETNALCGFIVRNGDAPSTELSRITVDTVNVASSVARAIASYADEDLTATLFVDRESIYTNLGKGPFLEIQPNGKKNLFERGYALPSRIALFGNSAATLNYDGSVSLYAITGGKPVLVRLPE